MSFKKESDKIMLIILCMCIISNGSYSMAKINDSKIVKEEKNNKEINKKYTAKDIYYIVVKINNDSKVYATIKNEIGDYNNISTNKIIATDYMQEDNILFISKDINLIPEGSYVEIINICEILDIDLNRELNKEELLLTEKDLENEYNSYNILVKEKYKKY